MRRLLWCAAGYASALLLGCCLLPGDLLPWAAGLCALLGAGFLLLRVWWRRIPALALCAAAVGFLWLWGYGALFLQPAEAFAGEKRTVTLRVTDYAVAYPEYSRLDARSVDGAVPHVRMQVYDYGGDAGLDSLRPGDLVELPLRLISAGTRYGAEDNYYYGEGICLRGYADGPCTHLGRSRLALLSLPKELARFLREQIARCYPEDVAPLMKALLTGDRTEYCLDDGLYSAMRTAGFSHIVAVSGMHVAFLVTLLRLLTGRRRITAFLGVPLILVFMAMIGFTPSVTRAGLMQILLLLASLLRREEDSPTSLAAAGLLILLLNPWAMVSLSFQLSFAAMAGLILVTPRVYGWLAYDPEERWRLPRNLIGRVLRWVCGALSASLGALVFTTPVSALWFGAVPAYGILTNLLCLWPMSTAFLFGYAVCLLGALWLPLGLGAGWVLGWLPRFTIFAVKLISRFPFALIYARHNLGAWWLIFVYGLFLVTYLLRGRERYRPALPLCAALFTFALLTFFLRENLDGKLSVSAVDVGQGQSIVALTEDAAVMIDCGSVSAGTNAGDASADFLLETGRQSVDLLVLTHFHADHVNGVRRLMSRVRVKRLAIPAEYAENDYSEGILALCRERGTEVYAIDRDTGFSLGDLKLTVFAPLSRLDENEACLLIYGDFGDFEFLVTGDAGTEVEERLVSHFPLGDMELLVAGHHGSRGSTGEALLDGAAPEAAFVSAGAGNRYGHPDQEVIRRLEARDIAVFRTDQMGTVTLTVGGEGYG